MSTAAVDCIFAANGTVQVSRVQIEAGWRPVSQGRQWLDQFGRHVLIMLSGEEVREIVLRRDTLTWEIVRVGGDARLV